MTLTAKEALGHVRHALSSDKMPTVGGLRILNDAGESLVNMHSWRWLEGAQASLSLRSGVDHVWLPESFRELISVVASNSLNAGISLTTPDQIARHRADSSGTALHYLAAVVFAPKEVETYGTVKFTPNVADTHGISIEGDTETVTFTFGEAAEPSVHTARMVLRGLTAAASIVNLVNAINDTPDLNVVATAAAGADICEIRQKVSGAFITGTFGITKFPSGANITVTSPVQTSGPGGAPRPRLDLWPTPGADKVNGLTAYFRAGWRTIRGDRDAISIPAFIEPLYIQLVRAVALGYERDSEADAARRMGFLRGSTMFRDARTRDSTLHPSYGPVLNGAASSEQGGTSSMWNFGNVGGPS